MNPFLPLLIASLSFQAKQTLPSSSITDSTLVASGAQLKQVAKGFSFTEGATVDKHGNIFFTDQPNNKIWEYDTHGKLSLYLDSAGRSNGMYIDRKGNLITCADENNQLWLIRKNKKIQVLVDNINGKKLNGPNDVWIAPNGDMYFTDPYYQRPYWTRTRPELESQNVYLLTHGSHQIITAAEGLQKPNGIVGTPDGEYLYVADIQGNKTYRYTIGKGGALTDKTLFASQGSDGMTLDERGNLYLTGKGVTVYNPAGEKIFFIAVPEQTSNLAFGGKHKDVLFITATKSLYSLQMNVHGVE
jgi:gluconolactonase